MKVGACTLDAYDIVPIHGEKRPGILRCIVQVILEETGWIKVLHERFPWTVQVSLKDVEGRICSNCLRMLDIESEWQLKPCVATTRTPLSDLEGDVTVVFEEFLLGGPTLQRAPSLRSAKQHDRLPRLAVSAVELVPSQVFDVHARQAASRGAYLIRRGQLLSRQCCHVPSSVVVRPDAIELLENLREAHTQNSNRQVCRCLHAPRKPTTWRRGSPPSMDHPLN
mmetsp:Transcript_76314/g.223761  ORF Transcript_76314/g.223761 Transcript_76314/m.223761 type:complete len:224 (+) Transcript_76314:3227-3898(+)